MSLTEKIKIKNLLPFCSPLTLVGNTNKLFGKACLEWEHLFLLTGRAHKIVRGHAKYDGLAFSGQKTFKKAHNFCEDTQNIRLKSGTTLSEKHVISKKRTQFVSIYLGGDKSYLSLHCE